MTPEKEISRGVRAQQILEDELFKEAYRILEQDIFDAWSQSKIRDKDGQHELLLMIQTARKFKAIFEHIVATGEMAKQDKPSQLTRVLERFGVYG